MVYLFLSLVPNFHDSFFSDIHEKNLVEMLKLVSALATDFTGWDASFCLVFGISLDCTAIIKALYQEIPSRLLLFALITFGLMKTIKSKNP
jgi:hypothetical protein